MADFSNIQTLESLREELQVLHTEGGNLSDVLEGSHNSHLMNISYSPIMQTPHAGAVIEELSSHISFEVAIQQFQHPYVASIVRAYADKVNLVEEFAKPDTNHPNHIDYPGCYSILGSVLRGFGHNLHGTIEFMNFAKDIGLNFTIALQEEGGGIPHHFNHVGNSLPTNFTNIIDQMNHFPQVADLIGALHNVGVNLQELLSYPSPQMHGQTLAENMLHQMPEGEKRVVLIESLSEAGVDFSTLNILDNALMYIQEEGLYTRIVQAVAKCSSLTADSAKIIFSNQQALLAFDQEGKLDQMAEILAYSDKSSPMSNFPGAGNTILGSVLNQISNNIHSTTEFINFAHGKGVDFTNVFGEICMNHIHHTYMHSFPTIFTNVVEVPHHHNEMAQLITALYNVGVNLQESLSYPSTQMAGYTLARNMLHQMPKGEKRVVLIESLSEAGVDFSTLNILDNALMYIQEEGLYTRIVQAVAKCSSLTADSAKIIFSNQQALLAFDQEGKLNQMAEILTLPDETHPGYRVHSGHHTILGSILDCTAVNPEAFVRFAHNKGIDMGRDLERKEQNTFPGSVRLFQKLLPNHPIHTDSEKIDLIEKLAFLAELGVDFGLDGSHNIPCVAYTRNNLDGFLSIFVERALPAILATTDINLVKDNLFPGQEFPDLASFLEYICKVHSPACLASICNYEAAYPGKVEGLKGIAIRLLETMLESDEELYNIAQIPDFAKAVLGMCEDDNAMLSMLQILVEKQVVTEIDQIILDDMSNLFQVFITLLHFGDCGSCLNIMDLYPIDSPKLRDAYN